MKKLYLTIIAVLLSITGQCFGEWKYDAGSNNFDSYIDYSRIKTEGLHKSIWALQDLKSPETNPLGKQFKSEVQKRVVDCQRSRSQLVALYQYPEQMGKGAVVFTANYQILEKDWEYEPPNSIGERYIKAACGTSNPKPPVSNTLDNKRQRCINLGLAPNSADFQQCMK